MAILLHKENLEITGIITAWQGLRQQVNFKKYLQLSIKEAALELMLELDLCQYRQQKRKSFSNCIIIMLPGNVIEILNIEL